tara:strand:+ start:1176 stop:1874 length:699 start_codon:yes stop_codon:yes gene_type:complete
MKAIILAGGKGIRMGKEFEDIPKSLLLVKGKPLLKYQLDPLIKSGINNIILLTGYRHERIQEFLDKEYSNLSTKLVSDPPNQKGSYICSLARIESLIDDDMILMHGDMIYEEELLKRLIEDKEKNLVTVHIDPNYVGKDFRAKIENNLIKKISTKTNGNLLMPLYKFSKQTLLTWLKSINEFVDKGERYVHAEEAIEPYADKIRLKPFFYDKELCMEIDDIADLKRAESLIY